MKNKIGIIGTGAYGTALANVLSDNGHEVVMVGIDINEVNDINKNNMNSKYFNEYKINLNIKAVTDWKKGLNYQDVIVIAVPSEFVLDVLKKINTYSKNDQVIIINSAKGYIDNTTKSPLRVIKNNLKKNSFAFVGGIYGPSISLDIIKKKPVLISAIAFNIIEANIIKKIFKNYYFHVLSSNNILKIENSSIIKNSLAIFSGIVWGTYKSYSTLSTYIALGIEEICKLFSLQYNNEQYLPAIADIILTTTSINSRNFQMGINISQSDDIESTIRNEKRTVEGINACRILTNNFDFKKMNMPLFYGLSQILFNFKKPKSFLIKALNEFK